MNESAATQPTEANETHHDTTTIPEYLESLLVTVILALLEPALSCRRSKFRHRQWRRRCWSAITCW